VTSLYDAVFQGLTQGGGLEWLKHPPKLQADIFNLKSEMAMPYQYQFALLAYNLTAQDVVNSHLL